MFFTCATCIYHLSSQGHRGHQWNARQDQCHPVSILAANIFIQNIISKDQNSHMQCKDSEEVDSQQTWKTTIVPTAAAAWAALGEGGSPAGWILPGFGKRNQSHF